MTVYLANILHKNTLHNIMINTHLSLLGGSTIPLLFVLKGDEY